MMKKLLLLTFTLLILQYANCYAESLPIYSTDITTLIDGKPIQGYAIDGKMMIALEDLKDYGFTVTYDDSIRTLLLQQDYTYTPNNSFTPQIKNNITGTVIGYTENTDINAYINSKYIHNPKSIGGKLVFAVEDLSELCKEYEYFNSRFCLFPEFYWSHHYDDRTRTLSVNTTGMLPIAFMFPEVFTSKNGTMPLLNRVHFETYGWYNGYVPYSSDGLIKSFEDFLQTPQCYDRNPELLFKHEYEDSTLFAYADTTWETSVTYYMYILRFYKNGRIKSYNLGPYDVLAYKNANPHLSDDGKIVYFLGGIKYPYFTGAGYIETVDFADYMLNLDTGVLRKAN